MLAPGGLPPRLRPLGLGEIIDQTLHIYARNFPVFFLLSAGLQLPVLLSQLPLLLTVGGSFTRMSVLEGRSPFEETAMLGQFIVAYLTMILGVMLYYLLLRPILSGSTVYVAARAFLGHKVGIREALRAAWRQALPLIVTAVVLGLGLGVLGMITLLPAIIGTAVAAAFNQPAMAAIALVVLMLAWVVGAGALMVYTYLYPQVIMVEGEGYFAAFGRSFRLVRGHFWRMVALAILFGLVMMLAGLILTLPFGLLSALSQSRATLVLTQALASAGNALLVPLPLLGATIMYFDLRIRKEGFDLQVMADWLAGREGP